MSKRKAEQEQERCIGTFVRYSNRTKYGVVDVLEGEDIDMGDGKQYVKKEDGTIHEVLVGYNIDRHERSLKWLQRNFCKIPVNRAALEAKGYLNGSRLDQVWIDPNVSDSGI